MTENAAPVSAFMELMKTTATMAANYNCTPFDIFEKDVDEVIMLIKFYTRLADEKGNMPQPQRNTQKPAGKQERIRVNDKTATNGWF